MKYRRVVLKLSGEALGPAGQGVDIASVRRIASEIREAHDAGVEIAIVAGAGNLVRGRDLVGHGVPPALADAMGITATVINGLALCHGIEEAGVDVRLTSAVAVGNLVPAFSRFDGLRHLAKGRVLIVAGGTGNPHFTTDSGAALRARELGADAVLKATNVDGVYSADPRKDPDAKRFTRLSFREVIERDLAVMDIAAIALCREGHVPIVVFDLSVKGNVLGAARGDDVGTYIGDE